MPRKSTFVGRHASTIRFELAMSRSILLLLAILLHRYAFGYSLGFHARHSPRTHLSWSVPLSPVWRPGSLENRNTPRHPPTFVQPNNKPACFQLKASKIEAGEFSQKARLGLYLTTMRPWTLLQAVGALCVGRLVVLQDLSSVQIGKEVAGALAVYFSYGAGMIANDCVDKDIDRIDATKRNRPIASGAVSVQQGWALVVLLSFLSMGISILFVSSAFATWILSCLASTLLYAAGLQRIFLIKNLVVAWLCVAPLVGATLFGKTAGIKPGIVSKLWYLAGTGSSIGIAREILKDAQDVDMDRGQKATLPLVLGVEPARRIAMGLVLGTSAILLTPRYYSMFASWPPWFLVGWTVSTISALRACFQPLTQQQLMVKNSIYAMLVGLILGLASQ